MGSKPATGTNSQAFLALIRNNGYIAHMGNKLTVKQEAFVQDVFTGMTYTQAYRNNYSHENMSDKAVRVEASRTMALPNTSLRLIELQDEASERSQVTVGSITKELEEARGVAKTEKQGAAMTAASMGKAKVNGLLVDKVDTEAKLTITLAKDVDDI